MNHIHLSTTDSTNTWVKKNLNLLDPEKFTAVSSDTQTQGRGRGKNVWISTSSKNLYVSFYFTLPLQAPYLPQLGLLGALTCALLLEKENVPIQLKWPNDLLVHGKKLGGVLTETLFSKERIGVVMGFGLNLEDTPFPEATSLKAITGKTYDSLLLLQKLGRFLEDNLLLLQEKGFSFFLKDYKRFLIYKQGDLLGCVYQNKPVEGLFSEIDPQGHLLLKLHSGEILTLISEETFKVTSSS